MITLLNPKATSRVTIPTDSGEPSVFIIGLLEAVARAVVLDIIRKDPESALMQLEVARYGLKSWENVNDHEGKPAKLETELRVITGAGKPIRGLSDQSLSVLPFAVISQVALEIMKLNFPQKEAEKNSPTP